MSEVRNRLQNVFREVFEDDNLEIFDEMTANDLDDWDSLQHITLIVAIEQEFSIKFTTPEIAGLKNVGDTLELIERKLSS
jgi:acyl carrier protein